MVGSLRPRKSVDYSKPHGPGTPTWLKLQRDNGDAAQPDVTGIEKENAKPASAERKAKKAAAKEQNDAPGKEQAQEKGRPPLARKDEADVTAKEVPGKKTKASADAAPQKNPLKEGPSSSEDKSKAKGMKGASAADKPTEQDARAGDKAQHKKQARKSEPAPAPAAERLTVKEDKRKSAPEKLPAKRALPESSQEAKPAGKAMKKVKTSKAASEAAEAVAAPEQPRKANGSAGQPPAESSDTWKTSVSAPKGGEVQEHAASKLLEADSKKKAVAQKSDSKKEAAAQRAADQPKPVKSIIEMHKPAGLKPAAVERAAPSNQPSAAQLPLPVASDAAAQSEHFRELQEEYATLQTKYQALKKQRIEQLEGVLGEQSNKAMEHRDSALKLMEHWKKEAERQAQFAQAAGSDRVREAQKRLEGENRTLRAQLLETEAALLAEQESVAELRLALAELRHREATPPKVDQAVQVSPHWVRMQANDGAQASCMSALAQASAVATRSHIDGGVAALSPEAVHLQEARAICPEGADLSERYHQPAHIPGASAVGTSCPSPMSGRAECNPSAKPLVPYSLGCSVVQPRSRFSAEAAAPAAIQADPVQEAQQVQAGAILATPSDAQAASAPAILNRAAWPALPKNHAQGGVAASEAQSGVAQGIAMLPPPQVDRSQLSSMTQKALNTLVGLEAAPAKGGGFEYTHRETGFVFEICPMEAEDDEGEEAIMAGVQELAFSPINMGFASQVLPEYLQEEIIFAATQKQKLVGRIMEALGTFTLRQARVAKQPA